VGVGCLSLLASAVIAPFRARLACRRGEELVSSNPAAAVPFLEEAATLDPNHLTIQYRLSEAYQQMARQSVESARQSWYRQADDALHRAISLVPVNPYSHANRGRLLGEMACLGLANPAEALAEWEIALAADPNQPTFLAEASRTALALGEVARARSYVKRGLSLYPTIAVFHSLLGACALREGKLKEAGLSLEQSLQRDWRGDREEKARALALLASTRLQQRRFREASLAAWRSREIRPDWPAVQLLFAQGLEALGDHRSARREYRRLLQLRPSHPAALRALQHLPGGEEESAREAIDEATRNDRRIP
jgi:tetratricopeptide (TPR) repeat protein